ncbi:MAG: AraC family transcriptional regulator [Clostridiales bacterium]|nr:AraC family transcriptional regulator [Clostridiales bacterium]
MHYDLEGRQYETVDHSTINHMSFYILDIVYCGAHAHSDFEILQVIHGSLHISTKDGGFDLMPGEVALFNSHEFHMCHSNDSAPCCVLVLQFNPAFCRSYFPEISYIHFGVNQISDALSPEYVEEIKHICFNIGYNFFGQKIAFEFRCISDVNRLFSYLLSFVPYTTYSEKDYLNQQNTKHRMSRIIEYIRSHYQEKLTLSEIASKESLSSTYLSSFFRKNMNQSFQSYLNNLRFEHALYLLQHTSRTIMDICIDSGFSDSKYLTKMFMNVYHMTPNDYRKNILSGNIPISTLKETHSSEEYKYTAAESLQILRKYHQFRCDDGSFVNYID